MMEFEEIKKIFEELEKEIKIKLQDYASDPNFENVSAHWPFRYVHRYLKKNDLPYGFSRKGVREALIKRKLPESTDDELWAKYWNSLRKTYNRNRVEGELLKENHIIELKKQKLPDYFKWVFLPIGILLETEAGKIFFRENEELFLKVLVTFPLGNYTNIQYFQENREDFPIFFNSENYDQYAENYGLKHDLGIHYPNIFDCFNAMQNLLIDINEHEAIARILIRFKRIAFLESEKFGGIGQIDRWEKISQAEKQRTKDTCSSENDFNLLETEGRYKFYQELYFKREKTWKETFPIFKKKIKDVTGYPIEDNYEKFHDRFKKWRSRNN